MPKDEIAAVEALVQEWIDAALPVEREILTQEEARHQGAIGLFDEHYSGLVSVYRIGDKSLEFCGGPHVHNTGELGRFHIVKEQSVGGAAPHSGHPHADLTRRGHPGPAVPARAVVSPTRPTGARRRPPSPSR
jgi:hypothetical protein